MDLKSSKQNPSQGWDFLMLVFSVTFAIIQGMFNYFLWVKKLEI